MKQDRFFYGWTIVGVAFVTLTITYGLWYSFSVFFVAILREFGWSRANTAGVFSLFVMVHFGAAIAVGSLLDRFGPRKLIPSGCVLTALGLFASSRITALWQLYISYGVVTALGICAVALIPNSIVLSRWFFKKRGLAIGIASAGIGAGMQLIVPLAQYIISNWGWRIAYCLLAAAVLFIVAPVNAVFQRRNPAEVGALPDGKEVSPGLENALPDASGFALSPLTEQTINVTLRTSRFWLLFVTFFFTSMTTQGTMIHQVAHVVDRGFSAATGAFFFGLAGIIGSAGKIFFGSLSDRIGRDKALTIGISLAFVGIICLMGVRPSLSALLYGYALLFGLGYGAIAPIYPARAADLFQGVHFGTIFGLLSSAAGFGGAAGAWLSGKICDMTGTYQVAFLGVLAAFVAIVILFWFTAPPPNPYSSLKIPGE